ncbi:ABC transporter permease [Treponema sp.]|uniref:ABC transporter permease n=1 Tax=Treponema sp. TaxID=166 RepID=UPI00388DACE4
MMWFLLMQKRLLKKPSFIVILLLILPLTVFFKLTSSEKSGVLTIAVHTVNDGLIKNFSSSIENVNFIQCDSEEEAKNLVLEKKADSAWLFDKDFEERILKAAKDGIIRPCVTVFEAEENTALSFSRELLYKEIYPLFSYQAYRFYVLERFGTVDEEILFEEYNRFASGPELFVHKNAFFKNGSNAFLLLPFRGLLSVWLMLCTFASVLYFMKDSKRGVFIWLHFNSQIKKYLFSLSMILIPLVSSSLIFISALICSSLFTNFSGEFLAFILFLCSSILFSHIIFLLCGNEVRFCAVLPLLILIFLVFCPVFMNIHSLRFIQYLLPPFYYLNAVYEPYFFIFFLIYELVLLVLDFMLYQLSQIAKIKTL